VRFVYFGRGVCTRVYLGAGVYRSVDIARMGLGIQQHRGWPQNCMEFAGGRSGQDKWDFEGRIEKQTSIDDEVVGDT
jgi:hypothetical protein